MSYSRRFHVVFLIVSLASLFAVDILRPRSACAGINEWTSIGPDGGPVGALAIDPMSPSTVYAGTFNGVVFKSTDGGGSWIQPGVALSGRQVTAIVVDPNSPSILYSATYGDGVFKSTNGGGS
jgi:hypothetical protein